MIEKKGFLPFGFLKAGGVQTGDHHGMRYRMIREKGQEEAPDRLLVWVWQEPFAFDAVPDDLKTASDFPFSEEGREAAIEWIQSQYEEHKEKWDAAPDLLTAFRMK